MRRFAIAAHAFEIAPLREQLLSAHAGAYASFEGWVRDHHGGRAGQIRATRQAAERVGEVQHRLDVAGRMSPGHNHTRCRYLAGRHVIGKSK